MKLIESSHWRLWIDSERGSQWRAAQVYHNDKWLDVMPDCRDADPQASATPAIERAGQSATAPLAAANFHMIPYSNRIRDARFTFDGKTIQLEGAEKHAMHGALRALPWQVTSSESNRLVCEFDSRNTSTVLNWPWPLHAQIDQWLDNRHLHSCIKITNHGESAMPVGTGWHPYFVRSIDGSQPSLTLPVSGVFPDASGDCLPDGKPVALPQDLDFNRKRQLNPDQRIDCCLAGLSGSCHIHWAEAGIELVMTGDDQCEYLVLFNPDMPHFAVEPVTNANDAFNLTSQNIQSGTRVLSPGETFSVSLKISFNAVGA